MLETIKEAATQMAQVSFKPELTEEVVYLLEDREESYSKEEMDELIGKLLSNIEEVIATFGG